MKNTRYCKACDGKTKHTAAYNDAGALVLECGNCYTQQPMPAKRATAKQAELDRLFEELVCGIETEN